MLTNDPTETPTIEFRRNPFVPIQPPAAGGQDAGMGPQRPAAAVCVWLTGPPHLPVARVAKILTQHLERRLGQVEWLPGPVPVYPPSSAAAPMESRDHVDCLTVTIGALLRHGISTVVSMPLHTQANRDRARSRIDRVIEVYLRSNGESDSDDGIPFVYRVVRNGEVLEESRRWVAFEPPLHPDIVVDGNLSSPEEVVGGILDVLERGRWLPSEAPPLPGEGSRPRLSLRAAIHGRDVSAKVLPWQRKGP
jgi:adenylylsulfate kinase